MSEQQQEMKCINPQCDKPFVVILPPVEIINSHTVSMVLWAHPEPQCCPHCGTPYQMSVQKVQGTVVAWGIIRTPRDAGIVVPPPGFQLPKVGPGEN